MSAEIACQVCSEAQACAKASSDKRTDARCEPLHALSTSNHSIIRIPAACAASATGELSGVSPTAKTVFGRPCHCLLALGSGLWFVGTASARR